MFGSEERLAFKRKIKKYWQEIGDWHMVLIKGQAQFNYFKYYPIKSRWLLIDQKNVCSPAVFNDKQYAIEK
jgi:hypothetical protein